MIRSCAKAKFGSVPATPQVSVLAARGGGKEVRVPRKDQGRGVGRVALPVISCCLVDVLDVVAGHYWTQWPQTAKKLGTSTLGNKNTQVSLVSGSQRPYYLFLSPRIKVSIFLVTPRNGPWQRLAARLTALGPVVQRIELLKHLA
jgi:hypothetical protein